jgi:HAMP domain-containing protein
LSQTASERLYNRLNSDISLGTGERYVSEIYIDKTTSEPMIVMAVPIKDTFGDFHGTIAAEVNLKFMWDLVNDIKVGNGGTAYVVNKQGNLIAFGDISRVLKGENVAQLDEVSKFVKGDVLVHEDNANMSKGIRGNTVVANHAHLGTPDWAVVVEMPAGEAYAPTISSAEVTILIVAANIMLVVLIGVYISRKITKPIISLRDAAKKIGMGSLNIKIKTATKNEIGELATSFNEMQRQLRISREELGKYTKNLEKMVKDRTSDLNSKVNELERFQKVSIERELRMIELKKRIKELEEGRK